MLGSVSTSLVAGLIGVVAVAPIAAPRADFQTFVAAAHRRGIRVLVDMGLNHVSNRYPYFVAAMTDTTSPYRGWFRWSPTKPDQKSPAGGEAWHKSPSRDEYYYGVFSASMPDLNYTNCAR